MENVEKVVNPPNNPIAKVALNVSFMIFLSNKEMTIPIKKDPMIFTIKVLNGKKETKYFGVIIKKKYLVTLPIAPNMAISR